ncbi:hypothetical protein BC830DRAFT_653789 [Chytriomyces sp. MP71]|nr:hypothetical protein BC830DRAFT_653789 [Chytriomyces sp. MP71]
MSATPANRLDALSTPITCTILGLCLDDSLCSIFRAGCSLHQEINLPPRQRKLFLKLTLFTFNIALSLNSFLIIWAFFVTSTDCFPVNMAQGLTFHSFMIIFDAYILYKSNLILGKSRVFNFVACVCLLYRMSWVVADIFLTFIPVSWDPIEEACQFLQDPLTGLNYTVADILVDVVSTIATVIAFWRQGGFTMDIYGLSFQLVKEAALRSVLCLGMDVFYCLVVFQWSGAAQNVACGLQNLIYLKVINLELWWKEVRDNQQVAATKLDSRQPCSNAMDSPHLGRDQVNRLLE